MQKELVEKIINILTSLKKFLFRVGKNETLKEINSILTELEKYKNESR